jgi:mannose-6-phosphate isomerase-like protein (cupin superfamily)
MKVFENPAASIPQRNVESEQSVRTTTACEGLAASAPYEICHLPEVEGVPCPCGTARRAFADVKDFAGTVHLTEISIDAKVHYHRRLTETYVIVECEPSAVMELNGRSVPVKPGTAVLIRPGTRHRAIGKMKVLIFCLPKFDPQDEWFD